MWRRRAPSPRQLRFAWLTELVRAIHADSRGTYGWRRVNAELRYGHGVIVNRKTVRKIMCLHGLHGLPGSRKAFRRKANMATAADLVERRFDRPAPDQLWVTDITEHPTREGKVYCCVVLDVFSRRVVGWSIDSHQATPLVTNALGMAITNRNPGPDQTVIHSDSEYVGAGVPGLPDPQRWTRQDAGAGMPPGFLTHTPTDERFALSFLGSVGGLGAPGEALASSTV
jgi:putative transposase